MISDKTVSPFARNFLLEQEVRMQKERNARNRVMLWNVCRYISTAKLIFSRQPRFVFRPNLFDAPQNGGGDKPGGSLLTLSFERSLFHKLYYRKTTAPKPGRAWRQRRKTVCFKQRKHCMIQAKSFIASCRLTLSSSFRGRRVRRRRSG